jgi:hypothetical protein
MNINNLTIISETNYSPYPVYYMNWAWNGLLIKQVLVMN